MFWTLYALISPAGNSKQIVRWDERFCISNVCGGLHVSEDCLCHFKGRKEGKLPRDRNIFLSEKVTFVLLFANEDALIE